MITGSFLKRQSSEIQSDPVLKRFYFFLVLIHFFTAVFWHHQGLSQILSTSSQSLCWPFFSRCHEFINFISPAAPWIVPTYVALILMGFTARTSHGQWLCLFALEFFKLSVQFLDYRFMGNYHFMPHILTLTYLFLPQKRFWLRIWLITFYLAAASLKLNFEWLSGGSLSWKVPFENLWLLQWGAAIVLWMEFVIPWVFLGRSQRLRWLALGILAIFHLASYYWVGFFYPAVMTSLLSFFVLETFHSPQTMRPQINPSLILGFSAWLFIVFAQILVLSNPRAAALGSERLWSLNMFDARSDCQGFFIWHLGKERIHIPFRNETLSVRVQCDPLIFRQQGRQLCQSRSDSTQRIEAHLVSKLWTDFRTEIVIRERDICQNLD